jgi:hypothetical protein
MKKLSLICFILLIVPIGLFSEDSLNLKPKKPIDSDNDGYLNISSLPNLIYIAQIPAFLSRKYELDCDINASASKYMNEGKGWVPIGQCDPNETYPFTGKFEGHGFVIDSLYICHNPNGFNKNVCGVFAELGVGYTSYAEIHNLGITNCTIVGEGEIDHFGIMAGHIYLGAVVENCRVSGTIHCEGKKMQAGGFAGFISDGPTIKNCSSDVTIITTGYNRSGAYIGGFASMIYDNTTIENCSSKSRIIMKGEDCSYLGGFAGMVYTDTSIHIQNCYSICDLTVEGDSCTAGGFAGRTDEGNSRFYNNNLFENCYSVMNVETSDKSYMGGFLSGDSIGQSSVNCFWDTDISGIYESDGGTGLPTAQMKTKSTFTDAGWDFENIWSIDGTTNDGYPFLKEAASGVEDETTSFPENESMIYPNPAGDMIRINPFCDRPFDSAQEPQAVIIYDYTGNPVYSGVTGEIDISFLPAGVYFVWVNTGMTGKFVKR